MDRYLNLAGIVDESVVDGPGLRMAVFAQGCEHGCPGCHNPETWEFDERMVMRVSEVLKRLDAMPHIRGITFTGGEPFEQSQGFAALAKECKARDINVWCYTGYTFGALLKTESHRELLEQVDVLVDGRFMEKLKLPMTGPYKGSENQRIIDVQQSLAWGLVVHQEGC